MDKVEAKNDRILGLKRNAFFLGLVSLFNDFSNEMVQSVMPVFLGVVLGVPPVGVGLIEGAADAIASFLKIISGWVSDKIQKRKGLAILGYCLSILSRPFFALAGSFSHVFALRVMDRMGKGIREAPRDALLAESVGYEEIAKSFGYHRAMDALGATIGPIAAFLILPFINYDYRSLFIIAFFIGLLSIGTFVFVKDKKISENKTSSKLDFNLLRRNKRFISYLIAIFIFGLGALPITLMLLYPVSLAMNNGGGSLGAIPLLYFIYSGTFVLTAIPLGRLADKTSKRLVVALGFIAAVIAYIGLAMSHTFWGAAFFFVVFGLYSGATDGVQRAMAARMVAPEFLATGEGLLNAATGTSALLAGLIGGLLWTIYGPAAAFIYGAVFSGLGFVVFVIFSLRK
ncbi:MAG: hypothetical protein A3E61_02625 [Candidatus Colwellbacteria bacterium RIFCSPHIGHO2_12_FULL_43_12]|uniref:Major facilitator superfamily (MFS) profile domain-containing protein n=3 Tax=Candidatus Colwelliibacteriota TaxID=1817904 RepID=A0A1G1Z014_9BACT|nr:MAG: hypothetical protein A3D47_01430 [Candidatus Colwellbacteria bacterium RIFCSPHIGHO2_02_FULL_43_15]OGY58764.1 MAG: hypothetical protein A3E61_02625 [Candidatus Colwellbacteria bacterium RIFCSPHIGHO2_12_FULL_43_12]OGY61443.1 MAG: hypothetical protein A3F99_00385 [Candidatus Colwellbacteria bacterium RIFCSPLOWO2_12_FULL_43_11]